MAPKRVADFIMMYTTTTGDTIEMQYENGHLHVTCTSTTPPRETYGCFDYHPQRTMQAIIQTATEIINASEVPGPGEIEVHLVFN